MENAIGIPKNISIINKNNVLNTKNNPYLIFVLLSQNWWKVNFIWLIPIEKAVIGIAIIINLTGNLNAGVLIKLSKKYNFIP